MKETIDTIIKWHCDTFSEETLPGQIIKFVEEMQEFDEACSAAQEDVWELADMVIVSAGISRFDRMLGTAFREFAYTQASKAGYDMTELWERIEAKMHINRHRVWSMTKEGSYHHICTGD